MNRITFKQAIFAFFATMLFSFVCAVLAAIVPVQIMSWFFGMSLCSGISLIPAAVLIVAGIVEGYFE